MKLIDYSEVASKVWAAETLEDKKAILSEAVLSFRAKGKNDANVKRFQASIRVAKSMNDLDRIAAQLALFPDNKVI